MTTLLSTQRLSKSFGGVSAVRDVDLDVGEAEIVGVIGPNGSGKSTFFNLVTGFLRPDHGRVRWLGRDVTRTPAHRRARRGLVRSFQERMVFDGTTVRENLDFVLVQRGTEVRAAEVGDVLELVGLPAGVLDQRAQELSWGQARLLGIAMGLLLDPRVLMLDEPFAGLNRVAARAVTEALTRACRQGVSLVVVEHELSLLLPLAGRIVVFAEGAKIAEDHPDAVLHRADVRAAYFGEHAPNGSRGAS